MSNCRTLLFIAVFLYSLFPASAQGSYSDGDGSAESPYHISTVEDWLELIDTPEDWDKHFILVNDIDFEGLHLTPVAPDIDSEESNHQGIRFTGTFDGQGYTLRNAVINLPEQDFVGLFGQVDEGGQILNLGVINIAVVGRSRVGGLVGRNYGGWISNCYSTGSVAGISEVQSNAGGLAGAINADGTVIDSYSTCAVSGVRNVGGLVGQLAVGDIRRCYAGGNAAASGDNVGGLVGIIYDPTNSGSIYNSYAAGNVSGQSNVGGLVGYNYRGKVINSYSIGKPAGVSSVGGFCGTKTTGTGYQDTGNFWDTQTSETITSAMGYARNSAQMKTAATFVAAGWDFSNIWWIVEHYSYPMLWPEATYYSGGSGTAEDPYQIASIAAWQKLMWTPPDWNRHFVLTADIDFGGMALLPIGGNTGTWFDYVGTPFTGVLDGQGYVLRNIAIQTPDVRYVGLFGYLGASAQVRSLGLETISVTGAAYVGGLVGQNNGAISNCYVTGFVAILAPPIVQEMNQIGGLAGLNSGSITECYAACEVSGGSNVGGLVGANSGIIESAYATGTVSGYNSVGGLVGQHAYLFQLINDPPTIRNSFACGDVSGNIQVGGLVGRNDQGRIIHCYSTGRPTGIDVVGGFCGYRTDGRFYEDTGNFWDIQTSGIQYSAMGTGRTTAQMQTLSTFLSAGWDFVNVWYLPPGDYPRMTTWTQDYSGGVGSEASPFRISTVDDWLKLIDSPIHWGRYFVLTNDIDFEGLPMTPVAPDINPLESGYQGAPFHGVFDGQGYVLRNAVIDLADRDFVGLFGQVGEGGRILNLGVENIIVAGRSRVGGLAGRNHGGWISNCYTTGSVVGIADVQTNVGGLAGAVNADGTVIDCYSTCTVAGVQNIGGLVGQLARGSIRRCYTAGIVTATGENIGGLAGLIYDSQASGSIYNSYAVGTVYGGANVGGLVGNNIRGKVINSYAIGQPTGTSSVGGFCGAAATGTGYQNTGNFWDIQTSQTSVSAMGTGLSTVQMKSLAPFAAAGWNFETIWWIIEGITYPMHWLEPTGYSGGAGTQANPYRIGNIGAWKKLMQTSADWDKHFVLTNDIDFGGRELAPVAMNQASSSEQFTGTPFSGVLNGQGYTLRNAVIDLPETHFVGLFGYVNLSGWIRAINLENITVSGGSYVGAIAGGNEGVISFCRTAADVFSNSSPRNATATGGLAGINYGTIDNCSTAGTVSGGDYVGGLVGQNHNMILSCSSFSDVSGSFNVGGLCGKNLYSEQGSVGIGTITNSYAAGGVVGDRFVGGLVGSNYAGRVVFCYAVGMPTGTQNIGGFCGSKITGHNYEDTGNFWDIQTSGIQFSAMGTGKTTVQMQTFETFSEAGWDMDNIWVLPEDDYPRLRYLQSKYAGGLGTAAQPFRILSAEDWLQLVVSPEDWDKHFVLVDDIDFEGAPLTPVASDVNPYYDGFQGMQFIGVLDGQGHAIRNAVIHLPDQDYVGLFGQVAEGGQILNLRVENISVIGRSRVGGLAGRNSGGLIRACLTSGSITGVGVYPTNVGGLVGAVNAQGTVIDSHSTCTVAGVQNVGGLVGRLAIGYLRRCSAVGSVTASGENVGGFAGLIFDSALSGSILNSSAVGDVSGGANVGGFVGNNHRGKVMHCYAAGQSTGTSSVGGFCGAVTPGTGYQDLGNFWDTETSCISDSAMGTGKTTAQMQTFSTFAIAGWNFDTVWMLPENNYPRLSVWTQDYSGGSGTAHAPYRLSTLDDWHDLLAAPADWKKHFILTNNIDFGGLEITPVAPYIVSEGFEGNLFTGTFDGQGYAVKNPAVTLPDWDCVGLFGQIGEGGQILNLGVENIHIVGRAHVGGLVGAINAGGTVINCYSTCTVAGVRNAGGLVGQLVAGSIRQCYAAGTVTVSHEIGGGLAGLILAPDSLASIRNSYAAGNVYGGSSTGGLVGKNVNGKVIHCYSTGTPTGQNPRGGFCGEGVKAGEYEDTGNFWDTQTSKIPVSAMGQGRTTVQMKTRSTFTASGWDFSTIWRICEHTNYPRLRWEVSAADWVCPDGVGIEDVLYLAARWLRQDCTPSNPCGGTDLNGDGRVDLADLALFAAQWLRL